MEKEPFRNWPAMSLSRKAASELQQYYEDAQKVGVQTASYIRLLIEKGRSETAMLNGCRGIIRLSRIFGIERMEAACLRGLQGNKYNYKTIKNILINRLDKEENTTEEVNGIVPSSHDNLRGASFFE
jgi:hypothetical protein